MGYHRNQIAKGVYGEFSKIREEFEEATDALEQNNPVMVLVELSDLLGAIKGYLDNKYGPRLTIQDLLKMADATHSAFESGDRK